MTVQFQPSTEDGEAPKGGVFRGRAVEIRNGMPEFRAYAYRGTGVAMSPGEAEWWLTEVPTCRTCAD